MEVDIPDGEASGTVAMRIYANASGTVAETVVEAYQWVDGDSGTEEE